VEAEEELIQGRPTALHPCGARHPLRGFLSKTPTTPRRKSLPDGEFIIWTYRENYGNSDA
jgi:hypothetical protein